MIKVLQPVACLYYMNSPAAPAGDFKELKFKLEGL